MVMTRKYFTFDCFVLLPIIFINELTRLFIRGKKRVKRERERVSRFFNLLSIAELLYSSK